VVLEQPGRKLGDATHCAVSGAVFVVEAESPKHELDGRTFYFCCAACKTYFEQHAAEVLAKRGWS
jgi:YHS domain-containing protein